MDVGNHDMISKFEAFLKKYKSNKVNEVIDGVTGGRLLKVKGYKEFAEIYSGASFQEGVYRFFEEKDIARWNKVVEGIFSQYKGQIECFASDWMGRIFAWDFETESVLLLDPGFGEALKIPCDFYELHNIEFVEYFDESLSFSLFLECMELNKKELNLNQCYGYKISPFLGGEDKVSNMEISDMEVYWSICEDIYNRVQSSS